MIGITGYGSYIPRLRLSRNAVAHANKWFAPNLLSKAVGTRAMANWDEDSITMAVAAARDCLGAVDDRSHVGAVYMASTSMPFADRLNSGVVAAALTLEKEAEALDITGSQRAAMSALTQALAKVQTVNKNVLVTASDRRKTLAASAQELDYGDAAAALLVGTENVLAEFLGAATITEDFVDHFRAAAAETDYHWEERWVRDEGISKIVPRAVNAALENAGISGTAIDHFIFPSTLRKMDTQLANACGIKTDAVVDNLAENVGDSGVSQGLLMLAQILESAKPGALICLAQFGQGAEAFAFRVTEAIRTFKPATGVAGWLARGLEETHYTKFLAFNEQLSVDKGMRAEAEKKTALSTSYRHKEALLGLVAGRCRETGRVHFPPTRLSHDLQNPLQDTQEPYKLAEREASVLSWSADMLSFSTSPPHYYGNVDFDGGGRLTTEFTDVAPGEIDNGVKAQMTFRIKDIDPRRGFKRYFWKATPVNTGPKSD